MLKPTLWSLFVAILCFAAMWSCSDDGGGITFTDNFSDRVDLGLIENDAIDEASGLDASDINPGVLWTHNDHNDENLLFAINDRGRNLGVYRLIGAQARDWEDIALGPGPNPDLSYIYVADIGDKQLDTDIKIIYRAPEPEVDAEQSPRESDLFGVETIAFRYPDGAYDAETIMLDAATKDIYIVTKSEDECRVYRAPFPHSITDTTTLEFIRLIRLDKAVGGDISAGTGEILIKNREFIMYWSASDQTQSVGELLSRTPELAPYTAEPQGEAVCWKSDNSGYYTLSEEEAGEPARLYFYARR